MSVIDMYGLSAAIAAAADIDLADVVALEFVQKAGQPALITATHEVLRPDLTEFDRVVRSYKITTEPLGADS